MSEQGNGLDDHGYIVNSCSLDKIQPEFHAVVNAVIDELCLRFPDRIDGIYLYGSVPRGTARAEESDLDVSIVFKDEVTSDDNEALCSISLSLSRLHPEISKLDLDPGSLQDILKPQEKYHWQFWLRHCCCCVWGNDLSRQFPQLKPSLHIARALNGDIDGFVRQMADKFERMSAGEMSRVVGKKLLRSAYYLIAEQDGSWHTDLALCARSASEYYPQHKDELHLAYQLATGHRSSKEQALSLAHKFKETLNAGLIY
ncbi:nucleotidyltransferase domain-containing protein [Vibrio breoganii]|nr:nucleotidyltransferase domain-containing protein [Vibrio breoganii]PMI16236.1 nucleotidyltransferase [Vibrio breoganii]